MAFAQDEKLKNAIVYHENIQPLLRNFSLKLREETDFKNVWFQLVDKNGTVVSRSWSTQKGDNLFKVRSFRDVTKVSTTIDVDKYDLSFKASVPIFDEGKFIGFIETITHFNSIAKKIEKEGFYPLVVVDKAYSQNLKHPFTHYFIDDYYIANKNVDARIVEHIKEHQGIEEFLAYKKSFTIDSHNYLIVHYTLFNAYSNKTMVYILMFQELNQVDTSLVKSMGLVINLLTLFSIIAVALILIFFYLRHRQIMESDSNSIKYTVIFVIIFLIIAMTFATLLQANYNKEKMIFFKNHNLAIQKDFDVIQNKYKTVAHTMYESVTNTQEVKNILSEAYHGNKEQARTKLYSALIDHYKFFQTYDIRQLHFHLRDNESFLRFHRPGKYGDNLTGIRKTVEWVNENHAPIDGFEEGRIYNGFRYVFPLVLVEGNTKEYLGSVETSFSAHAIAKEFVRLHSAKAGFVICKSVVEEKVFRSEQSNYIVSPMESFYYEKVIKKELEHEFKHIDMDKLNPSQLHIANTQIKKGELFTLASKEDTTFFTFIPLRNPISNQVVASIILQVESPRLLSLRYNYIVIFTIGFILILLSTIFIYRENMTKMLFENLSRKTKRILDTQKTLIVITDGRDIIDVNQSFLDFLGFVSIDDFRRNHRSISEFFITHENYFHLGKVPNDLSWVEQLAHIPDKDKVVLIRDKHSVEFSLGISYSYYEDEYYVVTFNDISGTIQEQTMLKEKIIMDSLTKVYNRAFFDANSEKIIKHTYEQGRVVAVLFFDIDHFKDINDIYGHDVGDSVLKELTSKVKSSIRDDDYLIRWGGEEFIILLSIGSLESAAKVAQNLRLMIAKYHFKHIGHLTCSFGVTLLKNSQEDIQTAIKRADQALYISKDSGRNQVTIE